MLHVGALPYSSPLPMGSPFPVMVSPPWNPTLSIQLGLVLTQITTSQPTLVMPQVPTCQSILSIPQPAQVMLQMGQLDQVVSK